MEERKFHINVLELSKISYNVLHIKGKGCNISPHPHGQHESPVIRNENGVRGEGLPKARS